MLIERMLTKEKRKRITMDEVLEFPLLKKVVREKFRAKTETLLGGINAQDLFLAVKLKKISSYKHKKTSSPQRKLQLDRKKSAQK